jgi:hypothetical protein
MDSRAVIHLEFGLSLRRRRPVPSDMRYRLQLSRLRSMQLPISCRTLLRAGLGSMLPPCSRSPPSFPRRMKEDGAAAGDALSVFDYPDSPPGGRGGKGALSVTVPRRPSNTVKLSQAEPSRANGGECVR